MRPEPKIPFNNFTMYEEPFNIITKNNYQKMMDYTFFNNANGDSSPLGLKDFYDGKKLVGYDLPKGGFFPATGGFNSLRSNSGDDKKDTSPDFSEIAGKGKICRSAGLSGAEKRACKRNIKATCGRKPGLFAGRAKKDAWTQCAQAAVITPEQLAQEAADKLIPEREDSGIGTGVKILIAVSIVGTLGLIGFAVANRSKAQRTQVAMA